MADLIISIVNNIPFWSMIVFALVFVGAEISKRRNRPISSSALTGVVRFGMCVIIVTCCLMAMNYVVNPFGFYPTHVFKPVTNETRKVKYQMLQHISEAPRVVILGSSRSLNVSPEYIQQQTGQPAFNASVYNGRPRDYLAFALYLEQRHIMPDVFIVGLGLEQLDSGNDQTPKFEADDPLDQYVQSYEVQPSILSIEQTMASVRQIALRLYGREMPLTQFTSTGMYSMVQSPQTVDRSVDEFQRQGNTISESVSAIQFDYLQKFLDVCKRHQVQVNIYLPPYHPRTLAYLEADTPYPQLRSHVMDRLASLKEQYRFTFYDFTDVRSFSGDATSMYDFYHPSDLGSQQLLTIMMQHFRLKDISDVF